MRECHGIDQPSSRSVGAYSSSPLQIFRTLQRQVQRQDGAHRQAAGQDRVAMLFQPGVRRLDTGAPLLPGRPAQFLRRAAVARKLHAKNGVPGARQSLRDKAQLDRRAAEPVNEEDANASSPQENAAVEDLFVNGHLLNIRP